MARPAANSTQDVVVEARVRPEHVAGYVHAIAAAAYEDGWFNLGLMLEPPSPSSPNRCEGPRVELGCGGPGAAVEHAPCVSMRRCLGPAAHAVAVFKHHALRFATLLRLAWAVVGPAAQWRDVYYGDRYLEHYANLTRPPWVLGDNLESPVVGLEILRNIGVLVQDRVNLERTGMS